MHGWSARSLCVGDSIAQPIQALGIARFMAHAMGKVKTQSPMWLSRVISMRGDLFMGSVIDSSFSVTASSKIVVRTERNHQDHFSGGKNRLVSGYESFRFVTACSLRC